MNKLGDMAGRLVSYGRRHGLRAVLSRSGLSLRRTLTGGRMALFFCDLNSAKAANPGELGQASVERITTAAQLAAEDGERIGNAWNVTITQRLHAERFDKGATLWLFKLEGKLAAYGWTMIGGAMEPHFFPLGANDAHLFDFFVFPEFRGRRINPRLVNHLLARLAGENRSRAFIEAAEWNVAQLASLKRTPFVALGFARKIHFFGKEMVLWSGKAKERSAAIFLKGEPGELSRAKGWPIGSG